jgi:hypothetical protein
MMLFDAEGKIKRYDSPEDILTEFFDLRLQYYEKRRVALLQVCRAGWRLLSLSSCHQEARRQHLLHPCPPHHPPTPPPGRELGIHARLQ